MRFALLIHSYFPYGGQQRDFMRIARECLNRGHEVIVYAFRWEGMVPEQIEYVPVPIKGLTRLARYRYFSEWVAAQIQAQPVDAVIGFTKMPGLDIYYAADPCFVEKAITQRGAYYQYTPRYFHFKDFEEQVFGANCATKILTLSELQRQDYLKHYPDCGNRMLNLPPGISPDRQVLERNLDWRAQLRKDFEISDEQLLLLQVGSGFRVKGVDRSLKAIAALPPRLQRRVHFLVIGQDRATRFRWQAQRLGLERQVSFLSGRDDIPHFFAGADMLLHPAYEESAGYVLLEAAIAGLPVLTTATCGYADYVKEAEAGEICAQPFSQSELNSRLTSMLEKLGSASWSDNGLRYGRRPELYTMPQKAVDYIEQIASTKESPV